MFKKGYGFVGSADGGGDIFVHINNNPNLGSIKMGAAVHVRVVESAGVRRYGVELTMAEGVTGHRRYNISSVFAGNEQKLEDETAGTKRFGVELALAEEELTFIFRELVQLMWDGFFDGLDFRK
ncbi:unnamed protein product, partial [Prorocentrum cordatum]